MESTSIQTIDACVTTMEHTNAINRTSSIDIPTVCKTNSDDPIEEPRISEITPVHTTTNGIITTTTLSPSTSTNTNTTSTNEHDPNTVPTNGYNSRKPKWWKKIAGRRGTKSQRSAISQMTQWGYVLPKLDRYQHYIKIHSELFGGGVGGGGGGGGDRPRGIPLTADVLLSPCDDDENEHKDNHHDSNGCVLDDEGIATTLPSLSPPPPTTTTTTHTFGDCPNIATTTTNNNNNNNTHTSLEIGFGAGDNLLTNAQNFPQRRFIGAEIHQPGVGTILSRMEGSVRSNRYWDGGTVWRPAVVLGETEMMVEKENNKIDDDADDGVDNGTGTNDPVSSSISSINKEPLWSSPERRPYDNVRIYPGDGIKLLRFLPSNSLDSMYITFPDPWPKPNQAHWRVVQEETVDEMARVLKPNVGCFYLATDAECFDQWTRKVFGIVNERLDGEGSGSVGGGGGGRRRGRWEEVVPCPTRTEWLPVLSKYEEKGLEEGRVTMVQCWRLVGLQTVTGD